MFDPVTFSFSHSGTSLFTPDEVRRLMGIEFERAKRYDYSICCLHLAVDRLEEISSVHGHEARETILEQVVNLLRQETRAGDLLGYQQGDRLTAMLPHTAIEGVSFLATRLLRDARGLRFSFGGSSLRITLSIGLSHNRQHDVTSYATLIEVAAEGVAVASAAGGDRWAETELYALHERNRAPAAPLPNSGDQPDGLRQRLMELMSTGGDLQLAASSLAEEILDRAAKELAQEREALLSDDKELQYKREIDNLRRRVAKLTKSLGMTEQELTRMRSLKNVDEGLASIYREVQGLGDEEQRAELKEALMASIFEANLDLQKKRTG